jgi:hypothetical protein
MVYAFMLGGVMIAAPWPKGVAVALCYALVTAK